MEDKNNNLEKDTESIAENETDTSSPRMSADTENTVPEEKNEPAQNAGKPQTATTYRWEYTSQYEHDRKEKSRSGLKGVITFMFIMAIAFGLAIAVLLGSLLIDAVSGAMATPGSNMNTCSETSLADLYSDCYPSYVAINVISEAGSSGVGSGIVLTKDGFIATNYHVVKGEHKINVILHDGSSFPAEYIDGDDLNDIAILKIEKNGLTPAKIGDSSKLRVGDRVMAIGTPYGIQYRGTMTSGYVSALNRQYAAKNENGTVNKVITLLQTDTSVNPGNSGGPLFNMDGEVIGIVSMKIAGSEYEGMGFAIPINGVIDMLHDIIKNGKLTISNGGNAFEGAALGITAFSVTKETEYLITGKYHYTVTEDARGEKVVNYITALGTTLQIPLDDSELLERYEITDYTLYTAPETGVLIIGTSSGFDSSNKLRKDDIILTANGISCEYMEALREIVAASRVGDKINLEVFRDGKKISFSVELGRSASMVD